MGKNDSPCKIYFHGVDSPRGIELICANEIGQKGWLQSFYFAIRMSAVNFLCPCSKFLLLQ